MLDFLTFSSLAVIIFSKHCLVYLNFSFVHSCIMDDDIENELPVTNIQFSQGSSELRVKTVKHRENGYKETIIERLKVARRQKQICLTRPTSRPIENTICLSVEDVKKAKRLDDCWRTFDNVFFRGVLVYGKVVVLNHYLKDNKTCYKFSVDDGSEKIFATFSLSREAKKISKFHQMFFENYFFNYDNFL